MEKRCRECKHYSSETKEGQEIQKGKCHRNPPCLVTVQERVKHYFPIVTEVDFCGEFEQK